MFTHLHTRAMSFPALEATRSCRALKPSVTVTFLLSCMPQFLTRHAFGFSHLLYVFNLH